MNHSSTVTAGEIDYPPYWGRFAEPRDRALFHPSSMTASDECRLTVYRTMGGRAGKVLIVPPPGVPFLVMSRLAAILAEEFDIVSWEMRGSSFAGHSADTAASANIARLARDLVEVRAHAQLQSCHVVTASGGALVLMWACAYEQMKPATASLVGPTGIARTSTDTPYKSVFLPLVASLPACSPEKAERVTAVIQRMARARAATNPNHDEVGSLFDLNVESAESLDQFGRLIASVRKWPEPPHGGPLEWHELFDGVCARHPVLIQHSRDDDVVDYRDSVDAAGRNDRAELKLYQSGGHLMMYTSPEVVAADQLDFMRRWSARDVHGK